MKLIIETIKIDIIDLVKSISNKMKETKSTILIVEDEENLHEALRLNLEMDGYEVSSAFDGTEALRKVSNEYFDLIIMDIMLPEIDGISVTERIRVNNME